MSMVKLQLMSDLHLETPKARSTYEHFKIQPVCRYLALLGDIGNTRDPRLFSFLREQLQNFEIVFYLLGNHETYGTTILAAQKAVRSFADEMEQIRSQLGSTIGRFVFLNQTRFDLTDCVTVLGCTLFSRISNEQRESVALFCSDFSEIEDWTVNAHNAAHQSDLSWLNGQVKLIVRHEPHRKIVVFTHHSPTILEAANDSRHVEDVNGARSAFVTDLSDQACWKSENVRIWAFGHTHFNCDLRRRKQGKELWQIKKDIVGLKWRHLIQLK
ncbi:related to Ser/Thr protein phosphatase superfamily [Phialocephala subalpina]|uniref:Related to Ser/Thr protein phosphatase superfamily n=1 Tax=Phialocephala subalpina TaxID=576137 RepID=A0A1L7XCI9_9HELO|nr:related to Ser/Thr protein phosphatase superfamily [Phialocephala subalpina]